ncbi:MAG: PEP-CTERM sorting domain-containing protein [Isosphaeraceae bacterium]
MRRLILTLALTMLAGVARPSLAGYVPNVTATTTMGSGLSTNLQNTVNGVGLGAAPLPTTTHGGTDALNAWVSSTGVLSGEVTFDLHGLYLVDQILFWNLNSNGAGPAGDAGIRDVVVLSSTDGIVFNPIMGGPLQFAKVPNPIALPETFTFAPLPATHLRFAVLNNWGDMNRTGFAEVAFQGIAVPEPSSMVLCGMFGVVALGGWMRKSRKAQGEGQSNLD